mmetsp:Transcript_41043/g.92609  ORF Transcript_41043/g.92609 Transcript_41043/m.92609 type:complete len:202 (+) Transcript_41043:1510-2115(+)
MPAGSSPRLASSPRPSWPRSLWPKHLAFPPVRRTHVCLSPAHTDSTVSDGPRSAKLICAISPGLSPIGLVNPLAVRPSAPFPQHFRRLLASTAQEWYPPAATCRTSSPSAMGSIFSICPVSIPRFTASPAPSWASAADPQHFEPPSVTAHVCARPAAICVTSPGRATPAGRERDFVSPWPSWPSLGRPQQEAVPLAWTAQA